MGEPEWFLGIHIIRDRAAGTITLSQRQCATTVVERYGMGDDNPTMLSMPVSSRLQREGTALEGANKAAYPDMIGALLYFATSTRPDIAYTVARLARYTAAPTEAHRALLKGVLRYVKGTQNWGLTYRRDASLTGYTDADFAGDLDTRRSTAGFVSTLNGAAVAWASKAQATVAAFTTEARVYCRRTWRARGAVTGAAAAGRRCAGGGVGTDVRRQPSGADADQEPDERQPVQAH